MKLIKTKKDQLFWFIALIWLICNITEAILTGSAYIFNFVYCIIMIVLIYYKNTNDKFRNWLDKKINEDEQQ